jgi:hypothetical protein
MWIQDFSKRKERPAGEKKLPIEAVGNLTSLKGFPLKDRRPENEVKCQLKRKVRTD